MPPVFAKNDILILFYSMNRECCIRKLCVIGMPHPQSSFSTTSTTFFTDYQERVEEGILYFFAIKMSALHLFFRMEHD